jgi:hypothetical protein
MTASQFDLDMPVGRKDRHRRLRLCDDLHGQKARDFRYVGIRKPEIAQLGKDPIGIHVISPGDLAHRHARHTRLPADHPLLVVRPDPTLPPLSHKLSYPPRIGLCRKLRSEARGGKAAAAT